MDKPEVKSGHHKAKNKKPPAKTKNAKNPKKKKNNGPTCSMFLSELTRKLAAKRREQEFLLEREPSENVIHAIISSLTNALPIEFSVKPPEDVAPVDVQSLSPELMPNEIIEVLPPQGDGSKADMARMKPLQKKGSSHKTPKMPLVNSDVLKSPEKKPVVKKDASMNTVVGRDVARELSQHVGTLRKISLIAEEFNQKTAKNLKDIVESVQIDLIKKLEEVEAEQKLTEAAQMNTYTEPNKIANSLIQQVVEKH